jgi:two-component system nitrate/nitrite response regulator NarL
LTPRFDDRIGTRVLVCSPVRLHRDGLASGLASSDGAVEVAGVAAGGEACVVAAATEHPDLVVLDCAGEQPTATVRALRGLHPGMHVVVIAPPNSEEALMALAEAGVAAYVTQDDGLADLVVAIRGARQGEAACPARTVAMLLRRVNRLAEARSDGPHVVLTRREIEILRLIDDGLSNKQIGRRLRIELSTVKNHVHHILEKLDVESRSQAAATLRRAGVLDRRMI